MARVQIRIKGSEHELKNPKHPWQEGFFKSAPTYVDALGFFTALEVRSGGQVSSLPLRLELEPPCAAQSSALKKAQPACPVPFPVRRREAAPRRRRVVLKQTAALARASFMQEKLAGRGGG